MYMSYCRYEGTLHELRVCLDNAAEHIDHGAEYAVSEEEITCFKLMVREFMDFMHDYGLLDLDGDIDEKALAAVCKDMSRAYTDD